MPRNRAAKPAMPKGISSNSRIRRHFFTLFCGEWRGWAPTKLRMYYESRQMARCIWIKFRPALRSLLGSNRYY